MNRPYIINDAEGNPISAKYPPDKELYGDEFGGYKYWTLRCFAWPPLLALPMLQVALNNKHSQGWLPPRFCHSEPCVRNLFFRIYWDPSSLRSVGMTMRYHRAGRPRPYTLNVKHWQHSLTATSPTEEEFIAAESQWVVWALQKICKGNPSLKAKRHR